MSERPVEVIRRESEEFVEATLLDGMRPEDLLLVEREWGPVRLDLLQELLRRGVPRKAWPESLHWDWGKKGPQLKLLEASGFGLLCEEKWQGIMLTKTASHFAKMQEEKSKPLVYVDYVESAPWNWQIKTLRQAGEFKGIGVTLFREALNQSVSEGFQGRVGLHALPQSEAWYRDGCGMTDLGRDPDKQNLCYFEFSPAQAETFLSKGGAT